MSINILKCFAGLTLMVLATACTPSSPVDEHYGAGFINVDETMWAANYGTPYPFTVPSGEISCGLDAELGREVYFEPKGFTDESHIGTPLNKIAANALKRDSMQSNVPYRIKQNVDLSEAVKVGLQVCDEMQAMLRSGS